MKTGSFAILLNCFSVDHDGRQTLHFGLSTTLTGQCLMSFGVMYWESGIKKHLTLSTTNDGVLEVSLETPANVTVMVVQSSSAVADGKLRHVSVIYKRGVFKLKINRVLSSGTEVQSKPMAQFSFMHTPIEFCGQFFFIYSFGDKVIGKNPIHFFRA